MKHWIYVLRKENFDVCFDNKFTFIGLPERNITTAKKIEKGDRIVLYLASGISKIAGILEIKSDYYEKYDSFWIDSFPIRLKTKILVLLKKENFVDIRKLIPSLTFIKNKEKWALYFMRSLIKIDDKDFKLIEKQVLKAKS